MCVLLPRLRWRGTPELHPIMCRAFHPAVSKLVAIFPFIEASRPRSKCGLQALCSLHVAPFLLRKSFKNPKIFFNIVQIAASCTWPSLLQKLWFWCLKKREANFRKT